LGSKLLDYLQDRAFSSAHKFRRNGSFCRIGQIGLSGHSARTGDHPLDHSPGSVECLHEIIVVAQWTDDEVLGRVEVWSVVLSSSKWDNADPQAVSATKIDRIDFHGSCDPTVCVAVAEKEICPPEAPYADGQPVASTRLAKRRRKVMQAFPEEHWTTLCAVVE